MLVSKLMLGGGKCCCREPMIGRGVKRDSEDQETPRNMPGLFLCFVSC